MHELDTIDAYWRAANYLSAGQIYLLDNAVSVPDDEDLAMDGRVMEILFEHLCQGRLESHLLTGRHEVFNSYEAFVHIIDSIFNQHAKWLKLSRELPWREPIASLIDRVPSPAASAADVQQQMVDARRRAVDHTRTYGEDIPEIRDWSWAASQ